MLSFFVSECVLLNRFLHSVKCTLLGVHSISLNDLNTSVDESSPFPGFEGCFSIKTLPNLWVNYVLITIVQCGKCCWIPLIFMPVYALTVIFALVAISAFRSCSSMLQYFVAVSNLIIHLDLKIDRATTVNSHTSSIKMVGDHPNFLHQPLKVLIISL